jgi:oxygen-independent coproporphyrinogen-3 oxidase
MITTSGDVPSRTTTAAPPLQKETTAGNYFVSNYPPFSYWKADQVPDFQAALDRPPVPGTPLGIYVHIPFCRKRCHFCYFKVYTDKDSAGDPRLSRRGAEGNGLVRLATVHRWSKAAFVYFGGGTPSYLSESQLKYLIEGMKQLLPWDAVEEVAFECEPGTLTDHKLAVIRELGVTRLSLGIEHFDDHILEINGRAHRSKEIARAYAFARQIGFPQINIDLIAGMVEETEEKWRMAVARTLELEPDSVTIYQMEVPFNTGIYQQMKADGQTGRAGCRLGHQAALGRLCVQ